MATCKITHRLIETTRASTKRNGRPIFVWDSELKGFGFYATQSGTMSWLVQKWQGGRGGRPKRTVIGHYPPLDLDEARKMASVALADVAKGIDLVDRKARARIAKREAQQAVKLGETVERFLKRNEKPGSYWLEVRRKLERDVIPVIGRDTTVASITKQELRRLVETKQDEGFTGAARYTFVIMRPFFAWCVEQDIIPKSPLADVKPPAAGRARDRILSDDEVRGVWTVTEDMPLFGPFYRLLLLTAQRREEVAAMSWSEVDLQNRTWTIPKSRTKNGKEHVVHLSGQAIEVLEGITRHNDSNLVFTTTGDTPISGYDLPCFLGPLLT